MTPEVTFMPYRDPPPRLHVRLSPGVDRKIRALARKMKLPLNRIMELIILKGLPGLSKVQDMREGYTLDQKARQQGRKKSR
jgi:hypothetical protein